MSWRSATTQPDHSLSNVPDDRSKRAFRMTPREPFTRQRNQGPRTILNGREADGTIKVARPDIYGGRIVALVPFTGLAGGTIKGTHEKR